ncbi:Peptidase A1 domain-containing protein [Aphelenchoides fujianensis]|nr:Peptidase A1 domain-containing protein [Aphelenchoides fujianensis]
MNSFSTCLLLIVFHLLLVATAWTKELREFRLVGRQHHRNAGALREFHRVRREEAARTHRNYIPTFPSEPILTTIQLGSPPKNFSVAIESGRAQLWVLDAFYPGYIPENPSYNLSESTSGQKTGKFLGRSGDFGVVGTSFIDFFTFIFPTPQEFGAVSAVTDLDFDPVFPFDGVLGLAWDVRQTRNDNPGFMGESESLITFGYSDGDRCDLTRLHHADLFFDEQLGAMAFILDSFSFSDFSVASPAHASVDTGIPLILVPYATFAGVFERILPDYDFQLGIYTLDCSQSGVLEPWILGIGGHNYSIPSNSYILDVGLGNGLCVLALDLSNSFTTEYALGSPFAWEYCQRLDIDRGTIAFLQSRTPE